MNDSYLIIDERNSFGKVDWSLSRPESLEGQPAVHIFSIATQWSETLRYFQGHVYFLVPMNKHSTYTWSLLKRLSKSVGIAPQDETWIREILDKQLDRAKNADLIGWSKLLIEQGWKQTAQVFLSRAESSHEAQIALQTLSLEEVRQQIEATARQSFTTYAKIPGETLTSVKLQPQTAGSIMSNLGVTYDLFKMIESDTIKKQASAFQLHTQIVTFLQQWGGPKQGLPNQEPFTERKRYTRASLLKLLQNPTLSLPTPTKKSNISKGSKTSTSSREEMYTAGWRTLKQIFQSYPQVVTSREGGATVELNLESIVDRLLKGETLKSKDWASLADGILTCILNKNEYVTSEKAIGRLEQISTLTKYSLDPWQTEMVEYIRAGRSVLVVGPTSGGKTFASMAAMDWLLNSTSDISLAYVAPTFHLALQTYANLVKSFKNIGISLVTGIINSLSTDTKIWVGTPADLWSYLSATDQSFTIGIFDEIHTLSETFGEGVEATVTSHAIANLLVKCKTQVIALSATIGDTDVTTIQQYLSVRTQIPKIETIVYRERFIPLVQYQYLGDKGFVPINAVPQISHNQTHVPTTMLNTFHVVKTLEKNDMLPAIIFDENEAACYDHYVAFVNWLEIQEYNAYITWHEINNDFEEKILDVNTRLCEAENEYHNKGPRSSALCRVASRNKELIVEAVKTRIRTAILKPDNLTTEPQVDISERHRKIYSLISRSILPDKVSALVRDLLEEFQRYNTLEVGWDGSSATGLDTIPVPCQRMGPYFTIGTYSVDFQTFKHMRNPNSAGKSQVAIKLHRFMKGLCAAERITEADVDGLLQLIDKGLQFGVGIILPTMPFIVQYELLRLLNNRKVSLIFSSRSMSMGINVPLRSVVIRSSELKEWNVCEVMQMSGRCGRRRLDTQGHVVYWNILNCLNVDVAHLPLIKIPEMHASQGSLISQPLDVAIRIEIGKAMARDVSAVKASLSFLNPTKGDIPLDLILDDGALLPWHDSLGDDDRKSAQDLNTVTLELSSIDERELSASITVCVDPVAISIGYNEIQVMDLVQRIQRLAMNKILISDKTEVYKTAEVISLIKRGVQELHTRYHRSSNLEWLSFMAATFELLHRVTYRQLRL
jgi:hypothetical protein